MFSPGEMVPLSKQERNEHLAFPETGCDYSLPGNKENYNTRKERS
jgi:hypothetical protein